MENFKAKTKAKVKQIAFDLIKLYAQKKAKGFSFSPDSYLQNELEASFIYEDTPDQEKATQDVKNDMENDGVMDRLICGDVRFRKNGSGNSCSVQSGNRWKTKSRFWFLPRFWRFNITEVSKKD